MLAAPKYGVGQRGGLLLVGESGGFSCFGAHPAGGAAPPFRLPAGISAGALAPVGRRSEYS